MNILLFLTPKQDVAFLYEDYTLEQSLRIMERVRYTSIPVIKRSGEYVGTITEGDLLWRIRELKNGFADCERTPLSSVKHHKDNKPLLASMDISDLLETAMDQNFAPVVDDRGMFIGIITRKKIITWLCKKLEMQEKPQIRRVQ